MTTSILPDISVIMPVYNTERYLKESIESILNQTFSNFELIILNDKSTDSSKKIIEDFMLKDNRIIFVDKAKNVGPAKLRNEGFDLAKGEFIAIMDADDISMPNRFEKQIEIMKRHPEIGVCGSWFTTFGSGLKDKIIRHPENHDLIKVSFLIDCTIGNSTGFIRKNILGDYRYDTAYVPTEDYELWSRLIRKTKFYIIQESLLRYRIHETNISQTKSDNIKASNLKTKTALLEEFQIEASDENIDYFIYLIEGQKGLSFQEIEKVFSCAAHLKEQNRTLNNFDSDLLEKMILKSLSRIVRKAKNKSFELLRFTKENELKVFDKINIIDRFILYLNAIVVK